MFKNKQRKDKAFLLLTLYSLVRSYKLKKNCHIVVTFFRMDSESAKKSNQVGNRLEEFFRRALKTLNSGL